MSALTLGGAVAAILALFAILMRGSAKKAGLEEGLRKGQEAVIKQAEQQNRVTEQANAQVVQAVEQVHEIHDRLESDPAYAKRVRDRFTRDD